MGIESTVDISRDVAIKRIKEIVTNIEEANWVDLYKNLNDEESYKDDYVNEFNNIYKSYLENNTLFKYISNWPNIYLEVFMDKPCVRFSQFENYFIID